MTRKRRNPLLRLVSWLGAAALALVLLVLVYGNYFRISGERRAEERWAPPGEMISVGTHRLHIYCVGSGRPTVVLDAPLAVSYLYWLPVMDRLESVTRVCAFDRSGLGFSEAGPVRPPTLDSYLNDLDRLLEASGEPEPYLFAGFSLGAQLSYQYVQRHLDKAAGLVSVEGSSPEMRQIGGFGDASSRTRAAVLMTIERLGLTPLVATLTSRTQSAATNSDDEDRLAADMTFLSRRVVSDIVGAWSMSDAFNDQRSLGDIRFTVIQGWETASAYFPDDPDAIRAYQALQSQFHERSTRGRHVFVESASHGSVGLQYELMAQEIGHMVRDWRNEHD